jgi:hypothetical protein
LSGCAAPSRALLEIRDHRPGRERMKIVMRRFDPPLLPAQIGDPVTGDTAYAVCVYDDRDRLVSSLTVDRAGAMCSTTGRPCWVATKGRGMRYADKDLTADGIRTLAVEVGGADGGRVLVKGKNYARRGRVHLPTGSAAALASTARATVQVVTSDADCLGITLDEIPVSNGRMFKGRRR